MPFLGEAPNIVMGGSLYCLVFRNLAVRVERADRPSALVRMVDENPRREEALRGT